jgi:hypothetical protein
VSPPPPLPDAGVDSSSSGGVDAGGEAGGPVQNGEIVSLQLNGPVAGAAITAGAATTTTDAKGKYQVAIDPTTQFSMKVQKDGYYTLTEQLTQVKGALDLGKTSLLSEAVASTLIATLQVPAYDPTLGVLSASVEKKGCADEGGATLSFTVDGNAPAPPAALYYVGPDGAPSPIYKSVQSGAFPSAVFYNMPPGKTIEVTVKHPTCTMVPFPVDKNLGTDPSPPFGVQGSGTVTYVNSKLTTVGGKATSFLRVFLK